MLCSSSYSHWLMLSGFFFAYLEVIWADVLVLEVVSMLPDVDAKQWHEPRCGLQGVLVCARGNLKRLALFVVALHIVCVCVCVCVCMCVCMCVCVYVCVCVCV